MNTNNQPIVDTQMLIRRPVTEVFESMVNPEITSKFWFTKGSGRVEPRKTLEWEWGQFGIKGTVDIQDVKTDEYLSLRWALGELKTTVEILFEPRSDHTTLVSVTEKGFWETTPENDDNLREKIELMLGQVSGWTLILASMKAWLEHELDLNLIADHKPDLAKQNSE